MTGQGCEPGPAASCVLLSPMASLSHEAAAPGAARTEGVGDGQDLPQHLAPFLKVLHGPGS